MSNQLSFLKKLLYGLKMAYGSPAALYFDGEDTLNLETGEKTVVRQKYSLRRAICLPTVESSESLLPGSLTSVWRWGGAVEWGDRAVAIDRRDLPRNLEIGTDNWSMVIDRQRYEVISVELFEDNAAYLLKLKALEGSITYEQIDIRMRDRGEASSGP
jgi:hypothetical protein